MRFSADDFDAVVGGGRPPSSLHSLMRTGGLLRESPHADFAGRCTLRRSAEKKRERGRGGRRGIAEAVRRELPVVDPGCGKMGSKPSGKARKNPGPGEADRCDAPLPPFTGSTNPWTPREQTTRKNVREGNSKRIRGTHTRAPKNPGTTRRFKPKLWTP